MTYILLQLITIISPLLYFVGLLSFNSLIYMGLFILGYNVVRISTALGTMLSVEAGIKLQKSLQKFKSGD